MNLHLRMKTAVAGGVWFATVAILSLPMLLSMHAALRPSGLAEATNAAATSAFFFGAPAAITGVALSTSIAFATSASRAFWLGVLLVFCTNVLAAVAFSVMSSRFFSLLDFGQVLVINTAMVFFLDVMGFYGIPFLLGGVAAVVFQAITQFATGGADVA